MNDRFLKIWKICSSRFESIAGFLYVVNIDKECFSKKLNVLNIKTALLPPRMIRDKVSGLSSGRYQLNTYQGIDYFIYSGPNLLWTKVSLEDG